MFLRRKKILRLSLFAIVSVSLVQCILHFIPHSGSGLNETDISLSKSTDAATNKLLKYPFMLNCINDYNKLLPNQIEYK